MRLLFALLCLLLCLVSGGCGQSPAADAPGPEAGTAHPAGPASPTAVDLDLTALSGNMLYAEVYNMQMAPEQYLRKTIRLRGVFSAYQNPTTDQVHCSLVVSDAAACCAQGFTLLMPDQAAYPQDYPPSQSQVTVEGTLQPDRSMLEQGFLFLCIEDVVFLAD